MMGDYFLELRNKVSSHKSFPYLIAVLRSISIYAIYALYLALMLNRFEVYYFQYTEEYMPFPNVIESFFSLILIFLMMNTVMLSFSIFHRHERDSFLKRHGNSVTFVLGEERGVILSDRAFWLELAIFAILYFVFPLTAWREALTKMLLLIPRADLIPQPIQHGILYLVYLGGMFFCSIHARINARKYWQNLPQTLMNTKIWQSMSQKKERSYSVWRLILRIVGYGAVYWIGIWAGCIVVPILISIVKVIALFRFEWWTWGLVGAVLLFILFFAFRKRLQFLHRLKKTCREYGFRVFGMRFPLLSLFHDWKRYTFGIEANGKTYYCRLVAGVDRTKKMVFDDNGICSRVFEFHIPAPQMAKGGSFIQVADRGNGDERVLFSIPFKTKYTFETEGEGDKILIVNPVPKRVMRRVEGSLSEADNGDRIGTYQIFTANAFLRHLQRESAG